MCSHARGSQSPAVRAAIQRGGCHGADCGASAQGACIGESDAGGAMDGAIPACGDIGTWTPSPGSGQCCIGIGNESGDPDKAPSSGSSASSFSSPSVNLRIRGCLIFFVGAGNVARVPPEYITGLYSSGTDSCITGLLR
mmetsp:Transcript_75525/g.196479  ORF Transcript_75525/g.196479 Transcript_75525/m.196479 type:complete len:139 (-) Transcript_75525:1533-1949(-)